MRTLQGPVVQHSSLLHIRSSPVKLWANCLRSTCALFKEEALTSICLPLCLGTLQTLSHCYLSLSVQSCLNVLSWPTSSTECPEWVEPEQPVCWMVLCCLLLYPRVGLDCYHVPARLPQGLHCLCHQLTVKPLEGPRLVLLWHVSHLSDVPRLHNLQKSPITLLYS